MKRIKELYCFLWDAFYYCQGNARYFLYYNKRLKWLLAKHIVEQIDFRIVVMNATCYNQGSCVECGCKTTALQMCNKACEGDCYPTMDNQHTWKKVGPILKKMYAKDPTFYYNFVKDINKK